MWRFLTNDRGWKGAEITDLRRIDDGENWLLQEGSSTATEPIRENVNLIFSSNYPLSKVHRHLDCQAASSSISKSPTLNFCPLRSA